MLQKSHEGENQRESNDWTRNRQRKPRSGSGGRRRRNFLSGDREDRHRQNDEQCNRDAADLGHFFESKEHEWREWEKIVVFFLPFLQTVVRVFGSGRVFIGIRSAARGADTREWTAGELNVHITAQHHNSAAVQVSCVPCSLYGCILLVRYDWVGPLSVGWCGAVWGSSGFERHVSKSGWSCKSVTVASMGPIWPT